MVTLTPRALDHVRKIRTESGDADSSLRISVTANGCSGFGYELFLDKEVKPDDAVSEFGDIKVLVDPMSLAYIQGTEVDYVSKSAYEASFHFNNPNATTACGCGKSFNTD